MTSKTIPTIDWNAQDMSREWKQFENNVQITFLTSLKCTNSKDQSAYIKIWISEKGREILLLSSLSNEDIDCPEKIMEVLRNHCQIEKSILHARLKFLERKQMEKETVKDFILSLQNMIKDCEYTDPDTMIRDKIVTGIFQKDIQIKLLYEGDKLTMIRAIEIATSNEKNTDAKTNVNLKNQTKIIEGDKETLQNVWFTIFMSIVAQLSILMKKWRNCIALHIQGKNETSKIQDQMNTINVNDVNKTNDTHNKKIFEETEVDHNHETCIFSVDDEGEKPDTVYATLNIGRVDKIRFKIDTGAQVNVIPAVVYNKLSNPPPLNKARHRLVSYTGQQLTVNGSITLQCSYKDKMIKSEFIIAEGCQSQPILSLKTSLELNLIQLTLSLEQPQLPLTRETVVAEYKEVFSGFGGLDGAVSIQLKDNAVPIVHAPRRVPYAIKHKVKEELDKMEKNECN